MTVRTVNTWTDMLYLWSFVVTDSLLMTLWCQNM